MAKLTQTEIKSKADEWVKLGLEIEKKEAALNAALDPYMVEYNEQTKPVIAKHQPKIERLVADRAEIESEVLAWLNTQGKPMTVAGELAVAAVETRVGSRSIDAQKFFDKVKDRSGGFWDCVTIAIAKAEKFLGSDKVDDIATKPTKLVASLKKK